MDKNTHLKKHTQKNYCDNNNDIILPKHELHEDIAIVTLVSGNSTFKVTSSKGILSTAFLPGKFKNNKRSHFVYLHSILLISFRHFQTQTYVHPYSFLS